MPNVAWNLYRIHLPREIIAKQFGRPFPAGNGLTHLFPSPEVLANTSLADIGLPGARADAIRNLARAVCDQRISFAGIADVGAFMNRLCEIPGIGKWTAEYVAMRAIREPDAFPSSDLGLLRGLGMSSSSQLEKRAEAWRPWRAYAAMYIWMMDEPKRSKKQETTSTLPESSMKEGGSPRQRVSIAV